MFFLFNKQKIYSYLIAASTVVILFILSFFLTNPEIETVETTSNNIVIENQNLTKEK